MARQRDIAAHGLSERRAWRSPARTGQIFASLAAVRNRQRYPRYEDVMVEASSRFIAAGFAFLVTAASSAHADDAADCDQQYDPGLAITACTRYLATPISPSEMVFAYEDRGYAYLKTGEYGKAAADFDAALNIDPEDVGALAGRGTARSATGDLAGAIAEYNKAIAVDPKKVIAYYNRGYAFNGPGQYEKAIADFDQAIALNPQYVVEIGRAS